jgi:hypothetical protein
MKMDCDNLAQAGPDEVSCIMHAFSQLRRSQHGAYCA